MRLPRAGGQTEGPPQPSTLTASVRMAGVMGTAAAEAWTAEAPGPVSLALPVSSSAQWG